MGLAEKLRNFVFGAGDEDEFDNELGGARPAEDPFRACDEAGIGRVVLLKPCVYVDAGLIADYMCQGYAVLLNLEELSRESARRLVDFLSGAAYGRDAQMLHVACNAYLLAPQNVTVMDEAVEISPADDFEFDSAFGF